MLEFYRNLGFDGNQIKNISNKTIVKFSLGFLN